MAKLSVELNRYFFAETRKKKVTLADILALAGERIFGFLCVILALPSALPIPAPGYSVPFGIALFILATQLILGREVPWLPNKLLKASLKLETVQGVVKKAIPWLEKIEALSKPRYVYVCSSVTGRIIIGSAIAIMAISMMIPIPGTNTLPAMGIFITAFGLLEDDGLITIVGLFVCSLGFTLSASILIFGVTAVQTLMNFLQEALSGLIS